MIGTSLVDVKLNKQVCRRIHNFGTGYQVDCIYLFAINNTVAHPSVIIESSNLSNPASV